MSDEPQFPDLPDIGDILDRKDRFVEEKHTVLKCGACQDKHTRLFKAGDFVFRKLTEEECKECQKQDSLTIVEIYSEWIDPKKKK